MIRGLWTAASGLLAGERIQDMLSNNLANVNTNGFKGQDGIMRSFPEEMLYATNDHTGSGPAGINPAYALGRLGQGAYLQEMLPRFTQGTLKPSENRYAFAIEDRVPDEMLDANGKPFSGVQSVERSFFAVEGPNGAGTVLTRDGDLTVSAEGFLKTTTGGYLLSVDAQGQPVANSRLAVDPVTHAITPYQYNGATAKYDRQLGPATRDLGLVTVDHAEKLIDEGNGVFSLGGAKSVVLGQALPGGNGQLATSAGTARRGFVEGSNVDPAKTMVDMISVMRNYEANSRVIRTMDQTLQKACDEVGKV